MGGGGKSPTEYKGGEGDYRKSTSSKLPMRGEGYGKNLTEP